MRAVGIKILKNRLSEYVRLAASGESVLVTDRDRVVAELGPPSSSRAEAVHDAFLAEAVRTGLLRPALVRSAEPPQSLPVSQWAELAEELAQDRDER
ncbi:MAG: prevent-host-death protein [Deltaproteobacteria bacterium]|nr:prevent-host-death protein [Deltaproteobacteria bacterium]